MLASFIFWRNVAISEADNWRGSSLCNWRVCLGDTEQIFLFIANRCSVSLFLLIGYSLKESSERDDQARVEVVDFMPACAWISIASWVTDHSALTYLIVKTGVGVAVYPQVNTTESGMRQVAYECGAAPVF